MNVSESQRTRAWTSVLRWAAALLVLGALVFFLPWKPLRDAVGRVPASDFVLILGGYLMAHAVGALKWRLVVNAGGAELDFSTSTQCYAGGLFGTLFLPSIVGGDVVRLAVGLRRSPRPAAVLGGNIADRVIDVAAQSGLVLMGLLLLPGSFAAATAFDIEKRLFVLSAVAAGLVILFFLLRRSLLSGRSVQFRRWLARLRQALSLLSGRPQVLGLAWIMGTAVQMTFLLLTARLAVFCGLRLPIRVWLFAWPLAKLAAVLPLTQGGIGIREAALVGLLTPFGASASIVFAAGLLWEGVIVAGGLVAGATALVLRLVKAADSR